MVFISVIIAMKLFSLLACKISSPPCDFCGLEGWQLHAEHFKNIKPEAVKWLQMSASSKRKITIFQSWKVCRNEGRSDIS